MCLTWGHWGFGTWNAKNSLKVPNMQTRYLSCKHYSLVFGFHRRPSGLGNTLWRRSAQLLHWSSRRCWCTELARYLLSALIRSSGRGGRPGRGQRGARRRVRPGRTPSRTRRYSNGQRRPPASRLGHGEDERLRITFPKRVIDGFPFRRKNLGRRFGEILNSGTENWVTSWLPERIYSGFLSLYS